MTREVSIHRVSNAFKVYRVKILNETVKTAKLKPEISKGFSRYSCHVTDKPIFLGTTRLPHVSRRPFIACILARAQRSCS